MMKNGLIRKQKKTKKEEKNRREYVIMYIYHSEPVLARGGKIVTRVT